MNVAPALPLGVWHHLAVVVLGSTGRLYLDGAEVATNNMVTINPSDMGTTTANYLGKSQYAESGDAYLSGRLDEVVISCRAFSFDEIQLLAQLAPP